VTTLLEKMYDVDDNADEDDDNGGFFCQMGVSKKNKHNIVS